MYFEIVQVSPNIWDTFEGKFVTQNFKKSPNLVTLDVGANWEWGGGRKRETINLQLLLQPLILLLYAQISYKKDIVNLSECSRYNIRPDKMTSSAFMGSQVVLWVQISVTRLDKNLPFCEFFIKSLAIFQGLFRVQLGFEFTLTHL